MAKVREVERLDPFWSKLGEVWFLFQVLRGVPDYEAASNVDLGLAPDYIPIWNEFVQTVSGLEAIEEKEAV